MDQETLSIYAELGLEAPTEQPEAAEPAGSEGANEQPVTGAAAEDQRSSTDDYGRGTGDPSPTGGTGDGTHPLRGKTSPTGEAGDGTHPLRGKASPTGDTGEPDPAAEDAGESSLRNGTMSREERAEQARLRRERETQARIDAALNAQQEKFDAQLKEVFDAAGLTNRYRDGAKIQTAEDFAQWKKDFSDRRLAERLQSGELTAEDFRAAVDASPALQEVRALAEQLKAGQAQAQRQEMDRVVADELAQIREQFDPGVKDLKTILDGAHGREFAQYVNEHGLSFLDAYRLAYGEQIAANRQKAAAAGAIRAAQSKSHLVSYGQNNNAGVNVPRETMAYYRELMPELSEAEIRSHYERYHKAEA